MLLCGRRKRSSNPIQRSTRHSQERPVLPRDRQEHPGPRRERVQQSPRAAARRPARCSVACGARAAGCAAYVVSERTGLSRRRRHRSSRCAHAHRRAASRTRARTHAGASLASAPGSRLSAGRAAQAKELSKRLAEARASARTTPHARAYILVSPAPRRRSHDTQVRASEARLGTTLSRLEKEKRMLEALNKQLRVRACLYVPACVHARECVLV